MSLFNATVPVFTHNLKNLSAILKIAEQDAKKRNIDPSVFLNARLSPDMFPLLRQVQIATDHAKGCPARLAGVEAPKLEDNEATFAQLQARIKTVLAFLKTLKASQFEGCSERTIEMKLPIGVLSFSGTDYVNGWVLPNFYFHMTTAYALLRANGVQLGKLNFLGMVPGMTATGKVAKMMGIPEPKKAAPKKSPAEKVPAKTAPTKKSAGKKSTTSN